MNREIAAEAEPAEPPLTAAAAVKALRTAAARLGVDPETLAARCADGELAEVILELRIARFNLPEADQQRVEELLRKMGVLPG